VDNDKENRSKDGKNTKREETTRISNYILFITAKIETIK
jgi:hypothetical protein